ncbi:hypothetical protein M514_03595 [Trichuris suis]|uniref:Uncharacterized protein n=1 Tax=Trichuris suis TaxID=68888 RepID=A0A085N0H5_9BILA|nr:hypothetical protein M513_03595 [Trichuris suis]KFD62971.1 hypothetical protein M514_03595 [Trichuris suis]
MNSTPADVACQTERDRERRLPQEDVRDHPHHVESVDFSLFSSTPNVSFPNGGPSPVRSTGYLLQLKVNSKKQSVPNNDEMERSKQQRQIMASKHLRGHNCWVSVATHHGIKISREPKRPQIKLPSFEANTARTETTTEPAQRAMSLTSAELVNVDVINIHVGGVYNDKPMAMERFVLNFSRLSKSVQDRLTLENDDKQYCPEDVLQLCHTLRVPFVYDVHHHRQEIVKRLLLSNSGHFTRCTYGLSLPEEIIAQTTMAAVETWKNREPLFHLSSPALGWGSVNQRPHHEMIDYSDFPTCWKFLTIPFTLEVEAKAKEVAVLQLNDALTSDGVAVRSCIVAMEETWDAIEIDGESKYRRRKVRVKTSQGTIHKLSSSSKRSKAAASSERKGRTRSQRNGANVVKANLQDVQGSVKSEKRIITRSITRKNASRNLN